jgi:hypothetical protein
MNAPTMNGMQQVNTWNLMEIIPMIPGVGSGYIPDQPAVINFFAGPNRWAWSIT